MNPLETQSAKDESSRLNYTAILSITISTQLQDKTLISPWKKARVVAFFIVGTIRRNLLQLAPTMRCIKRKVEERLLELFSQYPVIRITGYSPNRPGYVMNDGLPHDLVAVYAGEISERLGFSA